MVLVVKTLSANTGDIRDMGSIPGSGRSSGEGHGNRSSILAWRIPRTEEPGGLQSIGWHRIRHDSVGTQNVFRRLPHILHQNESKNQIANQFKIVCVKIKQAFFFFLITDWKDGFSKGIFYTSNKINHGNLDGVD